MKAFGYIRVSTGEQAKKFSLPAQREKIARYVASESMAALARWVAVAVFLQSAYRRGYASRRLASGLDAQYLRRWRTFDARAGLGRQPEFPYRLLAVEV